MPNNKDREWARRKMRVWSVEDDNWIAPPFADGGPELHNASTYSNWHCRCKTCTAEHMMKHRVPGKEEPSRSSGLASELPSSAASSDGGGATERA